MTAKWFDSKANKHQLISDSLTTLRNQQWARLKEVEINKRMYSEETANTVGRSGGPGWGGSGNGKAMPAPITRNRFSENLIKSCVDTIYAKIARNAPLPLITSDGGDGSLRRKAKDCNKFLWGKFDELKIHKMARLALRDALPLGTGCLKIAIDRETKNIVVKRVLMNQIFVDNLEAQYNKPKQLFLVTPVDKRLMQSLFPKFAGQLENAAGPNRTMFPLRKKDHSLIEEIEIVEAWKLPDEKGGKGRYVLCTNNCTLVDEEYEFDDFPFVFIHFEEPMLGFWGEGVAKMISDIQFRVNYTLLNIAENIRLCGKPTWLVPQGANIPEGQIKNSIGNVLTYKGTTPPQVAAFQTTNAEVFNWLQDQRAQAYKIVGVSELSAQSEKPQGLNSGVAMETYNDIESERFIMLGKQYEELLCQIADKILSLTSWAWNNRKKLDSGVYDSMFKSQYSRTFQVKQINWSDVNMKRDEFSLQIFPVSSLPQSPAGRQEKIQEYIQQGMIDRDTGRELLDFPDYSRWANLQEAGKENAERIVEKLFYEGIEEPIEPYHNVQYMMTYAQCVFNQQQQNPDVDEEALDRLRTLIDKCNDKMEKAQQAAMAQAQAANGVNNNNGNNGNNNQQ